MIISEIPRIKVNGFGFLPDSREIIRSYTITNKNQAVVKLITLGAGIQSIILPNKNDDMADVILGFDNVKGYLENRYIGRIVGRVCSPYIQQRENCTEKQKVEDPCRFDIVNWDSYILGDQVVMTYVSRHYSEGYFGDLMTQVKYTWTDENELHVDIFAESTKPTPVNIASYCLFNLAGHASLFDYSSCIHATRGMGEKELKTHVVTINADKWACLDIGKGFASGETEDVCGTIYDLRCPTTLSSKTLFKVPGGGYNHHLCVTNPISSWYYRFHGRILHPASGRYLEVNSNHPVLKLTTGNDLPNPGKICPPDLNIDKNKQNEIIQTERRVIGKDGRPYRRAACFGIIPQAYPKVSNSDQFVPNILHPGKIYVHNITYAFGIV